jgi:hypothetical protein
MEDKINDNLWAWEMGWAIWLVLIAIGLAVLWVSFKKRRKM